MLSLRTEILSHGPSADLDRRAIFGEWRLLAQSCRSRPFFLLGAKRQSFQALDRATDCSELQRRLARSPYNFHSEQTSSDKFDRYSDIAACCFGVRTELLRFIDQAMCNIVLQTR